VKNKHLSVGMAVLLLPQMTNALDFNIQPRVDVGAVHFEFDQSPIVIGESPLDATPSRVDGFKLSDTMPFVRGGLTFFVNRFFVDVDVQHAFDGRDTAQFTTSGIIDTGAFAVADNRITSDFHRFEFAVSTGYAVTEHLVLFAGYKRAESNFDNDLQGELNFPVTPELNGSVSGNYEVDFIYDGAFVGAANTWDIQGDFIEGGLTANVGVAFLDGKTRLRFGDFLLNNGLGQDISLPSTSVDRLFATSDLKGDTIGVSLGLKWFGFTPLKGFTYSLGVNGYRYDFDGKNTADFTDTLVRFSAGVQYLF